MIVLHLGAGRQKIDDKYKVLMKRALKEDGDVVSTVVSVLSVLEDSGMLNCGSGADKCDALIIKDYYGGITQTTTRNPIRAAASLMNAPRMVSMRMTPILISGDEYLIKNGQYQSKNIISKNNDSHDTVGCIAVIDNNICVGTSSGGIANKDDGRIGSSFVYGVGGFIKKGNDYSIAITSSGSGEQILLTDICRDIVNKLWKSNDSLSILSDSINGFIHSKLLQEYTNKLIGVLITIIDNGQVEILYAHTTPTFFIGYLHNGKAKHIFSSLPATRPMAVGSVGLSKG